MGGSSHKHLFLSFFKKPQQTTIFTNSALTAVLQVMDKWTRFMKAGCHSSHPNNNVKELKETQSTDPSLILSLSITGLLM